MDYRAKPVSTDEDAYVAPSTKTKFNVLLIISGFLTLLFLSYITTLVGHAIWYGMFQRPETYGAILTLGICGYIWDKTEEGYQRFIAMMFIGIIVICCVAWVVSRLQLLQYYYDK